MHKLRITNYALRIIHLRGAARNPHNSKTAGRAVKQCVRGKT